MEEFGQDLEADFPHNTQCETETQQVPTYSPEQGTSNEQKQPQNQQTTPETKNNPYSDQPKEPDEGYYSQI